MISQMIGTFSLMMVAIIFIALFINTYEPSKRIAATLNMAAFLLIAAICFK